MRWCRKLNSRQTDMNDLFFIILVFIRIYILSILYVYLKTKKKIKYDNI